MDSDEIRDDSELDPDVLEHATGDDELPDNDIEVPMSSVGDDGEILEDDEEEEELDEEESFDDEYNN